MEDPTLSLITQINSDTLFYDTVVPQSTTLLHEQQLLYLCPGDAVVSLPPHHLITDVIHERPHKGTLEDDGNPELPATIKPVSFWGRRLQRIPRAFLPGNPRTQPVATYDVARTEDKRVQRVEEAVSAKRVPLPLPPRPASPLPPLPASPIHVQSRVSPIHMQPPLRPTASLPNVAQLPPRPIGAQLPPRHARSPVELLAYAMHAPALMRHQRVSPRFRAQPPIAVQERAPFIAVQAPRHRRFTSSSGTDESSQSSSDDERMQQTRAEILQRARADAFVTMRRLGIQSRGHRAQDEEYLIKPVTPPRRTLVAQYDSWEDLARELREETEGVTNISNTATSFKLPPMQKTPTTYYTTPAHPGVPASDKPRSRRLAPPRQIPSSVSVDSLRCGWVDPGPGVSIWSPAYSSVSRLSSWGG